MSKDCRSATPAEVVQGIKLARAAQRPRVAVERIPPFNFSQKLIIELPNFMTQSAAEYALDLQNLYVNVTTYIDGIYAAHEVLRFHADLHEFSAWPYGVVRMTVHIYCITATCRANCRSACIALLGARPLGPRMRDVNRLLAQTLWSMRRREEWDI